MSLHRVLAPPPLALGIHPASPPKPKEDKKKGDAADGESKAKAKDAAADKGGAGEKKQDGPTDGGENQKADVDGPGDGDADGDGPESPGPASPASNEPEPPTPKEGQPPRDVKEGAKPTGKNKKKKKSPAAANTTAGVKVASKSPVVNEKSKDGGDGEKVDKADQPPAEPLPPIRVLPPVPNRPLKMRLDLDPARPYPPINTDPRGAYHKYAKAQYGNCTYIDVTKDGWLVEQWRERPEREALARLTGEADRQATRERLLIDAGRVVRRVPEKAGDLILDLWNDLVNAPSNEMELDVFWGKYDWSDPTAGRYLQIMPDEYKVRAKHQEKKTDETGEKESAEKRVGDKRDDEQKTRVEKEGAQEPGKEKKKNDEEAKGEAQSKEETKHETSTESKSEVPAYTYPVDVEWTKEGIELTLATIGIQCTYNTEKPLRPSSTVPTGGYLVLANGHFMLRIGDDIEFQLESTSEEFEALITTANDRVFGEMVKAQMAEERKKKEKEYKERKSRERAKEKEREKEKDKAVLEGRTVGSDGEDQKNDQEREGEKGANKHKEAEAQGGAKEKAEKKKKEPRLKPAMLALPKHLVANDTPAETLESPGPATPISNVKHHDGKIVRDDDVVAALANHSEEKEDDMVIVAVPIKHEGEDMAMDVKMLDEKRDGHAKVVSPRKADDPKEPGKKEDDEASVQGEDKDKSKHAKDNGKEKKDDKEKKPPHAAHAHRHREKPMDPIREAELLRKMFGPEAAGVPLVDLKMAFQAMEAAAALDKARGRDLGKRDEPMMWTWREPVERWRWKNFRASCAMIEEGCWEERDWKVFADERGMEEFEEDMSWEESLETDLHDWSC